MDLFDVQKDAPRTLTLQDFRGIFKGQAKIKSQFVTYAPEYQSSWLSS